MLDLEPIKCKSGEQSHFFFILYIVSSTRDTLVFCKSSFPTFFWCLQFFFVVVFLEDGVLPEAFIPSEFEPL